MSGYILPFFFIIILVVCFFKKVPVYQTFVNGAKNSLQLVVSIFPYVCAIMLAVALFKVSGLSLIFVKLISPVFVFFGIPPEVCELVLLRPFTGSGSFAILNDIFKTYGADSYIARCACTILGSSETIFYVATVYTSQTSVKKLFYAIPVALASSFVGAILSCLLCKIM